MTAGSINSLTILPPAVRGPQLKRFHDTFTQGARLLRELKGDVTDDRIDQYCAATENWANATYGWMQSGVGEYAAERFLFRHGPTLNWGLTGDHKPGYGERRSNCINALGDWLINLDNLMRDPTLYPEK